MTASAEMKRRLSRLAALVSALSFAPLVAAHAFLDRAIPAVGSAVHQSPAQLRLWFSEQLDPAFSRMEVLNVSGQRVDQGDPQVDSEDRKLLRVSLPTLAPGRYRVTWRVLSVDTHVSNGDFTFVVAP